MTETGFNISFHLEQKAADTNATHINIICKW